MLETRPRGIAVIRAGAIGDTLLVFPLLAALRARRARARLVAIGRTEVFELAREDGLCDAVLSPDGAGLWRIRAEDLALTPEDLRSFAGIDEVLDLDGGAPSRARALALGVEVWKGLDPFPPRGFGAPAAAHHLVQAGFAGASPFVRAPAPRYPESPPLVVLAPGAGSPSKRAPARWFAELARSLRTVGARIALVSGEADAEAREEFEGAGGVADERWEGLPLGDLRRRLARARGFASNDSGIAHLAAYVGLPGVVRFLATDPVVWAPPVPEVEAIPPGAEPGAAPLGRRLAGS